MNRAALVALALLGGACTDPIGPGDPEHEALCTIYVGADAPEAIISRWQLEHCDPVRVVVVGFGDSDG